MEIKTCFKCNKKKPISEFYAHPMMADGHLGKCKECAKKDAKENYRKTRVRYSQYDYERNQTAGRKAQRKKYQRRRRKKYPERYKAYDAVGRAIRNGTLIRQPCMHCRNPKSQAHHMITVNPLKLNGCVSAATVNMVKSLYRHT